MYAPDVSAACAVLRHATNYECYDCFTGKSKDINFSQKSWNVSENQEPERDASQQQ